MPNVTAEQFNDINFLLDYLSDVEDNNGLIDKLRTDGVPVNLASLCITMLEHIRDLQMELHPSNQAEVIPAKTQPTTTIVKEEIAVAPQNIMPPQTTQTSSQQSSPPNKSVISNSIFPVKPTQVEGDK